MANDITIVNHGTLAMVHALTKRAKFWLQDNVGTESWQWFGNAVAVEPRYVGDLVDGMVESGLEVR